MCVCVAKKKTEAVRRLKAKVIKRERQGDFDSSRVDTWARDHELLFC